MRVLAALVLAALALAPGAVALGAHRVEVASAAPEAVAEAAQQLPLAELPASAPAAVVQVLDTAAPVVAVVQPVLALPEAPPAPPIPEPFLTPDDIAAIVAAVEAAPPIAPAAVPEPYLFPRDEPMPLMAVAAPAPAAEDPAPPSAPSAAPAPAPALLPAVPPEAAGVAAVLLALGLYVRLAPGAALESPTRRRVLEAVRADPGCTVNTVARALAVDYKTAQHHLRVLRRSGFLHSERVGGWERYFVSGALPREDHAAAVVLRAPAARALAAALAEGSRARASDLARALGVSEATASVQLRRLAAAGVVRREADGLWAAA